METINERILFLIKDIGHSVNSFAKQIGHPNGAMINNIVGRRNSKPGFEILSRIIKTFPEINSHWLLTGVGQVYKIDINEIDIEQFRKNFEELFDNEYIWNPKANEQIKVLELENKALKNENKRLAEHLKDKQKLINILENKK